MRIARVMGTLVLACAAAQSVAFAQNPADYLRAIDRYTSGPEESASKTIAEVATWQPAIVDHLLVDTPSEMWTEHRRFGAAVLHTEVAFSVAAANPALGAFHFDHARGLMQMLPTRGVNAVRWRRARAYWFEFVTSVYMANANLSEADRWVTAALFAFPKEPVFYVQLGEIQELRILFREPNLQTSRHVPDREFIRVARPLEAAAADFRRALNLDERTPLAHLHLGWIHFVLRDKRAPHDLESALASAQDDRTLYLAHLFLGALAERDERWSDALREYTLAHEVGKTSQTAYVAMIRAHEALGHDSEAHALAVEFEGLPTETEDPWWDYRMGGLDLSALEWLRREVRQ